MRQQIHRMDIDRKPKIGEAGHVTRKLFPHYSFSTPTFWPAIILVVKIWHSAPACNVRKRPHLRPLLDSAMQEVTAL